MEVLLIVVLVRVICGIIAAAIASSKGRSVGGWFFGGFFLDIIGIIIVAVLPNLLHQQAERERTDRENRRLREQLRQERIKNEVFRQHAVQRLDVHDERLGVDTRAVNPALGGDGAARPLLEGPGPDGEAPGAAPGAPQWHYEREGQPAGPVPEAELVRRLRAGEIGGSTLLWTEGMPGWRAARTIPRLVPHLRS